MGPLTLSHLDPSEPEDMARVQPTQICLTERECQIIHLLGTGASNKEIAHTLQIAPRTVEFHLTNLYAKLGCSSRTQAAVWALKQNGL